jgi:AcrR family transcriptional regulator
MALRHPSSYSLSIDKQIGDEMATRGRPLTFDRDVALRSAMDLFWERGYEGTSMKDLSEAMGIASASIYVSFGSKEALFREAVALNAATQGQPPRVALREQPTAYEAIHAMLRAVADTITIPGSPRGCMLVLAAPTGAIENHPVREFLADIRRAQFEEIRQRLVRGVHDGDLAASTDSLTAIARYYTTVMHGLSVQARDGASRAELETVITLAMAAWKTLAP